VGNARQAALLLPPPFSVSTSSLTADPKPARGERQLPSLPGKDPLRPHHQPRGPTTRSRGTWPITATACAHRPRRRRMLASASRRPVAARSDPVLEPRRGVGEERERSFARRWPPGVTPFTPSSSANRARPRCCRTSRAPGRRAGAGLVAVDHLVGNVEDARMDQWVDFYQRVFGFSHFLTFDDKDISPSTRRSVRRWWSVRTGG